MRNFHYPGRSTAYAGEAMVATSSSFASIAALDVLKRGGNAMDAAVTASAVLCVAEPHMTGIGGDCFALIGEPDGTVKGLNASGRASARADADWLKGAGLEAGIGEKGIHSVTVPGAIDGWDRLLKAHGTMGLKEALAPAIKLARDGVPTTPRVAYDWARHAAALSEDEGGRLHFLPGGRAPRAGEVVRYPAFADTLEAIAKGGRDAFYSGPIAEEMVSVLGARGALLTLEDYRAAEADWVEPISTTFEDHDILEIPPSGQGIVALAALNILKRLDIGRFAPDSPERYHLQTEAIRLAFVLRARHVADPAHADVPQAWMLSDALADELASRIDVSRAIADVGGAVPRKHSDTIYLCVVDRNRLAVSFINSVYAAWGTMIVLPRAGFALHNRGSSFSTDPAHPNCIGPRKRPMHTIIPAMARKGGRVAMPFGVMGGDYQPMGQVQVALNMLVYGMDPQEALDFPRFFPEPDTGLLTVEQSVPEPVCKALEARGHRLSSLAEPLGGGQAIAIDWGSGVLSGGSDPRKDGLALGY
ncbi:MAG: gamma-glutamyltransferase family protein [Parvibaculaceae bacterium]